MHANIRDLTGSVLGSCCMSRMTSKVVHVAGSALQRRVLNNLMELSMGTTSSYSPWYMCIGIEACSRSMFDTLSSRPVVCMRVVANHLGTMSSSLANGLIRCTASMRCCRSTRGEIAPSASAHPSERPTRTIDVSDMDCNTRRIHSYCRVSWCAPGASNAVVSYAGAYICHCILSAMSCSHGLYSRSRNVVALPCMYTAVRRGAVPVGDRTIQFTPAMLWVTSSSRAISLIRG